MYAKACCPLYGQEETLMESLVRWLVNIEPPYRAVDQRRAAEAGQDGKKARRR